MTTTMTMAAIRPEQTTEVFVHYFNEGDIDRLIGAYYADGAVLAAAPGNAASGASLRSALQAYLDVKGKMRATTRHKLVAGDTALLIIDWVIEGRDASGAPLEVKGTSTDVVRRSADGLWRCVIDNPHNVA
jgi:ketosteroid isomerase-like protein